MNIVSLFQPPKQAVFLSVSTLSVHFKHQSHNCLLLFPPPLSQMNSLMVTVISKSAWHILGEKKEMFTECIEQKIKIYIPHNILSPDFLHKSQNLNWNILKLLNLKQIRYREKVDPIPKQYVKYKGTFQKSVLIRVSQSTRRERTRGW